MEIDTAIIQHRRGSLDDFNPEKLTPGELAVITDERSVYMGFPGGEAEKFVLEKDFTSESIKEKLGYEPADEERVDQLFGENAELKGDLADLDSVVFTRTDNAFDEKNNIYVGKRIHAYNAGQTINNPFTNNEEWVSFLIDDMEVGVAYSIVYNSNEKNVVMVCDIFNADGTYSRTMNIGTITNKLSLAECEKYVVVSEKIVNVPLYDTIMVVPYANGHFDEYRPYKQSTIRDFTEDIQYMKDKAFIVDVESVVETGLWNTLDGSASFNENKSFSRTKLPVKEGELYYLSGTNINAYNFRVWSIFDELGNVVQSYTGTSNNEVVKDTEVIVGSGASYMVVNTITSSQTISVKKYDTDNIAHIKGSIKTIKERMNRINEATGENTRRIVRAELRNPFKYKNFDAPYVTFCFDDGNADLDLVASVFAEFNLKLCVALPMSTLNATCTGLTVAKNGFTIGMKVKDVAKKIVENCGEVMCHSFKVTTIDNISDEELMYEKFVTEPKTLRENGFNPRGIILAGGTGNLLGGTETEGGMVFQYWSGKEFEYSDRYGMSESENYFMPRYNMAIEKSKVLARIDAAISSNKWERFFCHNLNNEGGYLNESMLRDVLQYCVDNNVNVVTWGEMYDNFGSTKLEKMISGN